MGFSGVGCHFLLQRVFLTQGLNPGLPQCRQTLHHLSHKVGRLLRLKWSEVKWSEVKSLSPVWLFVTPWTVAYQAPSMGFSRQEWILEWVAISFFGGSSQLRDWIWVSWVPCIFAGGLFTLAPPGKVHNYVCLDTIHKIITASIKAGPLPDRLYGKKHSCWEGFVTGDWG